MTLIARIQELQRTHVRAAAPGNQSAGPIDPRRQRRWPRSAASSAALADAEIVAIDCSAPLSAICRFAGRARADSRRVASEPNSNARGICSRSLCRAFTTRLRVRQDPRHHASTSSRTSRRELTELQLLQALARTESVELGEIDLRADQALEVARKYRRDWMNARASLVDSWRLIQFNADQLAEHARRLLQRRHPQHQRQSVPPPRHHRPPADRRAVRRPHHAARGAQHLPPVADRVPAGPPQLLHLRGQRGPQPAAQLRSIFTFQINFELQRLAVLQAARQVMLNTLHRPGNAADATTRATAARDAVQALSDLLNAQNQFMHLDHLRSLAHGARPAAWHDAARPGGSVDRPGHIGPTTASTIPGSGATAITATAPRLSPPLIPTRSTNLSTIFRPHSCFPKPTATPSRRPHSRPSPNRRVPASSDNTRLPPRSPLRPNSRHAHRSAGFLCVSTHSCAICSVLHALASTPNVCHRLSHRFIGFGRADSLPLSEFLILGDALRRQNPAPLRTPSSGNSPGVYALMKTC